MSKMRTKGIMMVEVILLTAFLLTCCTITPAAAHHQVLLPCEIRVGHHAPLPPLFVGHPHGHFEQYWIKKTVHNSSACSLSVQELLCKYGCESAPNQSNLVRYQRLQCYGSSIVFNNSERIHRDYISYLDLHECGVSLLNVGIYGEATDLKVVTFENCNFRDTNMNGSAHLNLSSTFHPEMIRDIIPGLGNIVSLTFAGSSGNAGNISMPLELLTHKWSALTELDLQMVTTSKQQLDTLRDSLPNLQSLYLDKCQILALPDFPWNSALQVMPNNLSRTDFMNSHYTGGEGLTLEPYLTRRMFSIKSNHLQDLSSYQFRGRLDKIVLTSNQIHALGHDTFTNVSHLQCLILKSNLLSQLPSGVFRNLNLLTELDLSNNYIESMSEVHFKGLPQLKTLNIARNSLLSITTRTFSQLRMLVTFDLSNNSIWKFADDAIGYNMPNLASVNLDNNNMTTLPAWVFTTLSLHKILLSGNRISFDAFVRSLDASLLGSWYKPRELKMVDLSYNNFTTLDFNKVVRSRKMEDVFKTILNFFILNLNGNDIHCDCHTYSMYEFLKKHESKAFSNNYNSLRLQKCHSEEWKCSKPDDVQGKRIIDLTNDTFVCQKELEQCPKGCICLIREVDESVIVNCSGQGLNSLPEQLPNRTDTLLFSHNVMKSLTHTNYLKSLKVLDVSHNHIRTITNHAVLALDHITSVKLHDNRMERLPPGLQDLQHVELTLRGNLFTCDCHTRLAVKYRMKIKDKDQVLCISHYKVISPAEEEHFICETQKIDNIGLPTVLSLIIVCLVVWYVYRGEIKVLLYYHLHWHPFDRTSTDISDKLYDAFVSYSKADTQWVLRTLQPTLESEQHPFRLCMETRDFRPGGLITDNILYSIKFSRRTIIVLTRTYLKNEWCRYEFKSAHHKVLKDRSNYLIVILFDGLDLDDLDEEMKLYLKTNTYIKHDSKLFWQRMFYAMPQKPLSVLREEAFPPCGYKTLFPTPESVKMMQYTQGIEDLPMHPEIDLDEESMHSESDVESKV